MQERLAAGEFDDREPGSVDGACGGGIRPGELLDPFKDFGQCLLFALRERVSRIAL